MSRRRKLLAIMVVVIILIAFGIVLDVGQGSRVAHSPDGGVIKLEDYAFRPGTVRYDVPNRPFARALAKVLPDVVIRKIGWARPGITVFAGNASFPNEPLLSAAFSSRSPSGNSRRAGTRLVVANERGQAFDSVLNSFGNGSVFEASAFPRRGKELRLRLMYDDSALAEFRIPNPCPGPHPVWKAGPIPVAVTNAELEIILEKFAADTDRLRTWCVFRVRENGHRSTTWLPAVYEVSDATGNHWRPAVDPPLQGANGRVIGCFLGALWPDEDAWKVRVEFRSLDKESKNRLSFVVEFLAKPEQLRGEALPELRTGQSRSVGDVQENRLW